MWITRLAAIVAGLILTTIAGTVILHSRYQSGLAPIPFIVTAYMLGVLVYAPVIRAVFNHLATRILLVGVALLAIALVLDESFQFVFWFLAIPSCGGLAATWSKGSDHELGR